MPNKITKEGKQFILNNLGKMKQYEIAKVLNVRPSCISQIKTGKRGKDIQVNELFFNVDSFLKQFNF